MQISNFRGSTVSVDVGLDIRIFRDLWCSFGCMFGGEIYGISAGAEPHYGLGGLGPPQAKGLPPKKKNIYI